MGAGALALGAGVEAVPEAAVAAAETAEAATAAEETAAEAAAAAEARAEAEALGELGPELGAGPAGNEHMPTAPELPQPDPMGSAA